MTPEERANVIVDEVNYGRLHFMIAEAIKAALKERDFHWWSVLCLVNTIAPTPEAVKTFVMQEAELMGKELIEAARDKIIGIIRHCLCFNSQREVSWHEVQDCINEIIKEIK